MVGHHHQQELWQEEAKKLGGDLLVEVILEMREGIEKIITRLDQMEQTTSDLHAAFPAGDIEGHKRYHETVIKMLEEKRRLRIAIQEKTISGLVWAGIIAIGTALWEYFKKKVGG